MNVANETDLQAQDWLVVPKCPLCESDQRVSERPLAMPHYLFNTEIIHFPPQGIQICHCAKCGLIYKTVVPSTRLLADVFRRLASTYWNSAYDFADEVTLLQRVCQHKFDLLDVGPSDGGLLRACASLSGRRSGLDIVKLPGLDNWLRGEFIQGLVEDSNLDWSGEPYDVVTLFDVMEHLYRPKAALENLTQLTKSKGVVVIETGAADSDMPSRFGVHEWWYANLFEHHIFWTASSLSYAAQRAGFKIAEVKRKRHKQLSRATTIRQLKCIVKTAAYVVNPSRYKKTESRYGKIPLQPWNPASHDHMLVVMKRR